MNTIQCPHCKKHFEPSEAIAHELQEKIREEEKKSLKIQFEKEKVDEQANFEKKLRLELEQQNKEQLEEQKKKQENSDKREKELIQQLAKSDEQRKKDIEKAREDAIKQDAQQHRLEKLEYEKKLSDMQKSLEEAQRKGKQGSQQLQGEALELDLESKLKEAFPTDEFVPIPKGVEGGDIWQKIRFRGNIVGSILWETKRTKAWSKSWLIKLKDDVGRVNATEAILVSQVLPVDSAHFDRKEGIWITTYEHAINICRYVRFLITSVATVKSSTNHTEEEWGQIRDYMMSEAFKNRMQSHFDNIHILREILRAERRSTELKWKKQEAVIEKMDRNTTSFYGELKTIVANLPELNGVETLLIEDENEKEADF